LAGEPRSRRKGNWQVVNGSGRVIKANITKNEAKRRSRSCVNWHFEEMTAETEVKSLGYVQ